MTFDTESHRPDESECTALMIRYNMPVHVRRHSRSVCGVALFLTRQLASVGIELNVDLVRAGALLHDITKAYSFNRPLDHALTGAKVLKKLGYHDIAAVVRQHVRLSKSRPAGRITEIEVVNYADKRVVEDRITSLNDRMDYIMWRYGQNPDSRARLEKYVRQTVQLEKEIFEVLPWGPVKIMSVDIERECERK